MLYQHGWKNWWDPTVSSVAKGRIYCSANGAAVLASSKVAQCLGKRGRDFPRVIFHGSSISMQIESLAMYLLMALHQLLDLVSLSGPFAVVRSCSPEERNISNEHPNGDSPSAKSRHQEWSHFSRFYVWDHAACFLEFELSSGLILGWRCTPTLRACERR